MASALHKKRPKHREKPRVFIIQKYGFALWVTGCDLGNRQNLDESRGFFHKNIRVVRGFYALVVHDALFFGKGLGD